MTRRIILTVAIPVALIIPACSSKDEQAGQAEQAQAVRTFTGHRLPVTSVTFTPDGLHALSGSWDNLKLWDIRTGACLRTFTGHEDFILSVAISPDGLHALSGSRDSTLKLWDLSTGECLRTFLGHTEFVPSVTFSPDGLYALSCSYDDTLKLWDVQTGVCLRTFTGHRISLLSVAFSPDGLYALAGSYGNTLTLWDVQTGECLRTFIGHVEDVHSVAFTPDGRGALSGSRDGVLKLWDVQTGKVLRTFIGHTNYVLSVAVSPDGLHALSGGHDGTVKLWDIQTAACLRTFTGHRQSVNSVAFSPDGRHALSGGDDGTVKLWPLTDSEGPDERAQADLKEFHLRIEPSPVNRGTGKANLVLIEGGQTLASWPLDRFLAGGWLDVPINRIAIEGQSAWWLEWFVGAGPGQSGLWYGAVVWLTEQGEPAFWQGTWRRGEGFSPPPPRDGYGYDYLTKLQFNRDRTTPVQLRIKVEGMTADGDKIHELFRCTPRQMVDGTWRFLADEPGQASIRRLLAIELLGDTYEQLQLFLEPTDAAREP